jgi:hypothetical protein
MTPEEEQKLRNFRLLGGGSSMELPQQQQPIAPILGQAGSGQGFAISPSILGQVPGIENITLGQAPIVSQEGIQYQTPEVQGQSKNGFFKPGGFGYEYLGPRLGENIGNFLGSQKYGTGLSADGEVTGRPISPNTLPGQTATLGATSLEFLGDATQGAKTTMQFAGQGAEYLTGLNLVEGGPVGQTYEQAVAQQEEQVAPTIQSIAGVEQTYEQAQGLPPIQLEALERLSPQPEATFTLPSGEVRSIMPGQDVASAFGRESGRPMTFQVDGGEVTVPSAQAIQTMNLGEQAAARQAQQEFLASPAAREMSNRMLQSVMYNDPYAQASAERVARMEAKPDFNRAVSDRERRGTGEMSRSEATRIAEAQGYKGQQARDVADGYITLQRQGRDPITGQPMQTGKQGLTFDQNLSLEKFNYERAKDQVDWAQADAETKAKRTDDMNTEVGALTSIIGQTENVAGLTEKAAGRVGANTVGFFSPLKFIGGTDAADLAGDLETIKSDAFVANITEMRQNSPTGGAVGNVSDKDLEMLQSLQTSFRQNLKPSTLRSNLKKYQTIRNKVAEDAKAGFIRKYGEENFNRYFGGGGGNPSGQSTEQGNFDYGDSNYEIIPGR